MDQIVSTEWQRETVEPLPLYGRDCYYVFPSYGDQFRDMSAIEATWTEWDCLSGRPPRFWPGFSGGGILALPFAMPPEERHRIVRGPNFTIGLSPLYGLVCGNLTGGELAEHVARADPERPPGFAVRWGLAKRVPNPSVSTTAEHAGCLTHERYVLVVPKEKRKSVPHLQEIGPWFASFGITTGTPTDEVPSPLRTEIQDWFDNPSRRIWTIPVQGGIPNAAWQLAVLCYVAEFWWISAKGLQDVHFVANIEGAPNFRKFWTSNR